MHKSFTPLVHSHVDNVLVKTAPDLNQRHFSSSTLWISLG